jgi:hypothetical protein
MITKIALGFRAFVLFLLSISKGVESRASGLLKIKKGEQPSSEVDINRTEVSIKIDGRQEHVEDPFDISLELADKIQDEDMIKLYKLIEKERGEFLDQKFREYKATALALSGEVVVPFHKVPSLEDTDEIEKRTGKICYVFLRPPILRPVI